MPESLPVPTLLSQVLVGDGTIASCLPTAGPEPYPDNWRAVVKQPETPPHHAMVLHRGAYPDGDETAAEMP
jgi:hypothetical protein